MLIAVVCEYQFNPIPRTGIIMVSQKHRNAFHNFMSYIMCGLCLSNLLDEDYMARIWETHF